MPSVQRHLSRTMRGGIRTGASPGAPFARPDQSRDQSTQEALGRHHSDSNVPCTGPIRIIAVRQRNSTHSSHSWPLTAALPVTSARRSRSDIDQRLITLGVAGGCSSRDTISHLRLEKAEGLFGHGKSNGAAWRFDAGTDGRRSDLHGASGCVRSRCWRVRASFGTTYVFLHTGNCAYLASPLDNNRCGSSGQHGQLLQKSGQHGRLPAVVHDWCGKIFDRGIVRCRCAIICALLGRRCNLTPRKVGGVHSLSVRDLPTSQPALLVP